MDALKKLRRLIVKLLEIIGGALLISMVIVVFIGVIDRFLLGIGLPWPEELSRYHLLWLSFMTAALTVTTKGHFVIDFVYKAVFKEHPHQRKIIELIANLIVCAVSLMVLFKGAELVQRTVGQESPAMGIQMSWVYCSLPLCFS